MNQDLLNPIDSPQGSCGEDMSFSVVFDAIQEARRFDDPTISQGEWVTDLKEADWGEVIRLGEQTLATQSKDLRLGAWVAEARCYRDGLNGLSQGVNLVRQLCEAFWEEIHPQVEDGDLEQRIGLLDWFVQQSQRLLREIPIISSDKGDFSLLDRENARSLAKKLEQNPREAQQLLANKPITLDAFESSLKHMRTELFRTRTRELESLLAEIQALQTVLDAKLASDAPGFSAIFETIDELNRLVRPYAGTMTPLPAATEAMAENKGTPNKNAIIEKVEPTMGAMQTQETITYVSETVSSREHAIRQLYEIAAFFKRTEPHSPVAYLAEKAAKWGEMPLHEWLRSVVKDNSSLSHMEELLGVEPIANANQ